MVSSRWRIASLANNSVARGCGVPLGRMVSFSTLVRSSTSDISTRSSSTSSRPGPCGRPSMRSTDGRATSASTSMTVLSSSAAMLSARLIEVKLLPSPASALVTIIRLEWLIVAAPLPIAFLINGRLMTRYWSPVCERGVCGIRKPCAARATTSSSTRLDDGWCPSSWIEIPTDAGCASTTGAAITAGLGTAVGNGADSAGRACSSPGRTTPAWRSCSSLWAACSIRLVMSNHLPAKLHSQDRQCNGKHRQQPSGPRRKTDQLDAQACAVRVRHQPRDDAQDRQLHPGAQIVRVVEDRTQLACRKSREETDAQGRGHRTRQQQQAVGGHGLGVGSRRVDHAKVRHARGDVELTRDRGLLAALHQVFVVALVDRIVAIQLSSLRLDLRRRLHGCQRLRIAARILVDTRLERRHLDLGRRNDTHQFLHGQAAACLTH
eukprot:m.921760 g.921760  ORF g.921760 m.921760 type:complete len:435 (-) comp90215_c0_seq1:1760-3064(-)